MGDIADYMRDNDLDDEMGQKGNKADYEFVGCKIPIANLRINKPELKSYGFKFSEDRDAEVLWIPKSQVKDWIEDKNKGMTFFAIPRWLFVKNEMDQFYDEDYVDFEAV